MTREQHKANWIFNISIPLFPCKKLYTGNGVQIEFHSELLFWKPGKDVGRLGWNDQMK